LNTGNTYIVSIDKEKFDNLKDIKNGDRLIINEEGSHDGLVMYVVFE